MYYGEGGCFCGGVASFFPDFLAMMIPRNINTAAQIPITIYSNHRGSVTNENRI